MERSHHWPVSGEVRIRDDGRVRVVTLNRPHRLNVFTATTYRLSAREVRTTGQALAELPEAALVTAKRLLRAGVADLIRHTPDREREAAAGLHDVLGPMG